MTTIGTVTIDGEPPTGQQQVLVSALALRRHHGATIEMLVDALWPGPAPSTARKSLQNQIARLRQCYGSDLISTRRDRYFLDTGTDIDLIDQLMTAVRPDLTPSEEASMSACLATWHGEPYIDLDTIPLAQAERARLEHVQAQFIEALAISRISRWATHGIDAVAIVDLTVRASTYPLHERAWELLVAMLQLSGRRTEALGTFARFCTVLNEELGVQPSQRFHHLRAMVDAGQMFETARFCSTTTVLSAPTLLASA